MRHGAALVSYLVCMAAKAAEEYQMGEKSFERGL